MVHLIFKTKFNIIPPDNLSLFRQNLSNLSDSFQVSSRLLWVLSNVDKVKECLKNNDLLFGTLDTWLLYKLTNGRIYLTDVSNASATGFFDLFKVTWGPLPLLLNIPSKILPKVVDCDYQFGMTSPEIFGHPINIGCVVNFLLCLLEQLNDIVVSRWVIRWLPCLDLVVSIETI